MRRGGITSWHGDAVLARVQDAARRAIDDVNAEAARDAQGNHWWQSRDGQLESNIVHEPAERTATGARGRFGTTARQGFYGLILERKRPFLRPAADREWPDLADAIRRRLR